MKRHENPEGHRRRLRDRFAGAGRTALADYELLELLLTHALPRINTKPIAKALLDKYKSILGVLQQPREQLEDIDGIGPNASLYIKVIHACLTRCTEAAVESEPSIAGPEDLFAFVRLHLGVRPTECVYALYLDSAKRVVHHCQVAEGTVNRATLYMREVIKPALDHNATGLVLVHNHPGGKPVPSENDLDITGMVEKTARMLGIEMIDHIIVTRTQAFSLKTGKLL